MTQSSFKIAITGGIGSGKSSVAEIIAGEGYPVFSCDKIYSELLTEKAFLDELSAVFEGIIGKDGKLDRQKLSEIVFKNEEQLQKLNALTHEKILSVAFKKMDAYEKSFLEVPLLFENGFEAQFDGVIVVLRDLEKRIASVMRRDKITREQVISRINRQFNYDNFNFTKYYVIHNNGDLSILRHNVLELLKEIKFH